MDDHIILPPSKKKRKRRKIKFEFSKYFSAIIIGSIIVAIVLFMLSAFFIKITQKSTNPQTANQLQSTGNNNPWLTFKQTNYSFKYPASWANVTTHTYSTTTEVNVDGKLIFQEGFFYNQDLGKNYSLDDYVSYNKLQTSTVQNYTLDGVEGKLIVDNKDGVSQNLIILPVGQKDDSLLTISFKTATDSSENAIINQVLSSFKFTTQECGVCPNYVSPVEGWCTNGIVVPGGKDKCGCQLPPICQPTQTNI